MRAKKARGEGWGQYANSGCTFWCSTTSMEWFGDMGYHSPPPFPSLSPRVFLYLCPPPSHAYCSHPSLCPSPPPTHTHALILHLPHGTPLLHPPKCPSPEYEIRLLSPTEVQEWDAWRANCWCVGFWVIITSLSLQENSKLMFNFPLLLKGSPPLLLPWQLAEAKA